MNSKPENYSPVHSTSTNKPHHRGRRYEQMNLSEERKPAHADTRNMEYRNTSTKLSPDNSQNTSSQQLRHDYIVDSASRADVGHRGSRRSSDSDKYAHDLHTQANKLFDRHMSPGRSDAYNMSGDHRFGPPGCVQNPTFMKAFVPQGNRMRSPEGHKRPMKEDEGRSEPFQRERSNSFNSSEKYSHCNYGIEAKGSLQRSTATKNLNHDANNTWKLKNTSQIKQYKSSQNLHLGTQKSAYDTNMLHFQNVSKNLMVKTTSNVDNDMRREHDHASSHNLSHEVTGRHAPMLTSPSNSRKNLEQQTHHRKEPLIHHAMKPEQLTHHPPHRSLDQKSKSPKAVSPKMDSDGNNVTIQVTPPQISRPSTIGNTPLKHDNRLSFPSSPDLKNERPHHLDLQGSTKKSTYPNTKNADNSPNMCRKPIRVTDIDQAAMQLSQLTVSENTSSKQMKEWVEDSEIYSPVKGSDENMCSQSSTYNQLIKQTPGGVSQETESHAVTKAPTNRNLIKPSVMMSKSEASLPNTGPHGNMSTSIPKGQNHLSINSCCHDNLNSLSSKAGLYSDLHEMTERNSSLEKMTSVMSSQSGQLLTADTNKTHLLSKEGKQQTIFSDSHRCPEYDPEVVRQKVASMYNNWVNETDTPVVLSSPIQPTIATNNLSLNSNEQATVTQRKLCLDKDTAVTKDKVDGPNIDRSFPSNGEAIGPCGDVSKVGGHPDVDKVVVWPQTVPDKLNFHHLDIFEGQMLLQWLTGVFTEEHYLYYLLTKQDLRILVTQFCTHLLASGVMKPLEDSDNDTVFKPLCMYYWTHTDRQYQVNKPETLPEKLIPIWPPPKWVEGEDKPGLKYTEADVQSIAMGLKKEYAREIIDIKKENQQRIDNLTAEHKSIKQELDRNLRELEKEIENYKSLIENLEIKLAEEKLKPPVIVYKEVFNNKNGPIVNNTDSKYVNGHTDGVNGELNDVDCDITGASGHPVPGVPPPPAPPLFHGVGAPPIPPPPPPGFPSGVPPPPPPMMMGLKRGPRKPPIKPVSTMKPLFWKRVQIDSIKLPQASAVKPLWEKIEEPSFNVDAFVELFSKVVSDKKKVVTEKIHIATRKQVAKLLDAKRSQNLGILISSKRLDVAEVENAIIHFDTSAVTLEDLQAIYDSKPNKDELSTIRRHLKEITDIPLDRPEQFLHDLSEIPNFEGRLKCFLFQSSFMEAITSLESKLANLKMTSQMLLSGGGVHRVMSLILAFGNYMNGGSRTRGQADGFGLEILAKVKDVKSKDNSLSLLHYLVTEYINKFDENAGTDRVKLPIPEPSDVIKAAEINFDDVHKELRKLKKDLNECQKDVEKVVENSDESNVEPFQELMKKFSDNAFRILQEEEDNLEECKTKFDQVVLFYCVQSKSLGDTVTPKDFFLLWISFCNDFKDLWKKEQHKILKKRLDEEARKARELQADRKTSITTKTKKLGGLKSRLSNRGRLQMAS